MPKDHKRTIIEKYIKAYNNFEIDEMLSVIHPDIEFKNISGDVVNVTASCIEEFQKLAVDSKKLFSSRKQTITEYTEKEDQAFIQVDYQAVLAENLPNGMKVGEILSLVGRSEFTFRDGKIYRIVDIS